MSDPLKALRKHQRFILDDDDLLMLEAAAKPRLLLLTDQRRPIDISNECWQALGLKHQFEWDSVRPSTDTRDKGIIRAIPLDASRVEPALPDWAIPKDNDDD